MRNIKEVDTDKDIAYKKDSSLSFHEVVVTCFVAGIIIFLAVKILFF